jgi:eukaryotic-like serine/threonine-protein kinase
MPPLNAAAGAAPRTIGRYRVEALLGRGAMGAVYLACDPARPGPVAIKTMALGPEFADAGLADARERFAREIHSAGRLRHRGIVAILDAGEADGVAYIVMEALSGHDLQRHTAPDRLLPAVQVLRIGERVADALGHAHGQGVVHRDIKPANVIVDAAANLVKLTDFGVARLADARRTRTGLLLGTPSYMSPEQLAGQQLDGRSDLYSLGVMLFQLLTGALPHRAEAMAARLREIASQPAPDVRSLRPELPEAVAGVIARALAKRPDERPADGARMALDLRRAAGHLAVEDGPDADLFAPPAGLPAVEAGHNRRA